VLNGRRLFILAIVSGTILRLVHIFTSLGTVDALIWFRWVELIERVGILQSYRYSELMNHPPLALLVAKATHRLGNLAGLEFQDSFRLLQTAADVVTAFSLARIVRRVGDAPSYAPVLFFLSPAAIFISGFHCNSDPLMTMLLVLAIEAAIAGQPMPAGIAIAASAGIKIVPLLLIPFVLLAFRGRARIVFVAATAVTGALIFVPALVAAGPLFVRHVFGWTGMPVGWGLRYLALATHADALLAAERVLPAVTIAILALLWFRERRGIEPARLLPITALVLLILLVLARGFGVQYLFWLLPFLGFLFERRKALALHGIMAVFVFMIYTAWSQGWPWWYADATRAAGGYVAEVGFLMWLAFVAAAVAGARKLLRA
jgi:glycosyl transferase family 87